MRASTLCLTITAILLTVPTAQADLPPLDLVIPQYETHILDNGLTLLIMERHAVPLVSLELWLDAGAAADPQDHEGLATLTADALRKGAGKRDAATFARDLDFLGAEFETRVDHDRTAVGLSLLAKDLDTGLELFADAVLRPAFLTEEITKLAQQQSEGIGQAKDNPRRVLSQYFRAALYGDHAYGRPTQGTETSTAALTREDVVAFHRQHYGADRAILAVVGDFSGADALKRLQNAFTSMEPASGERVQLAAPRPANESRVLLVNKNDTPQTWFQIGNLGPAWDSPDYAAVEVVRTVLGGRFTSWLNTKLRIESGLSYGANFAVQRGRVAGPARISSFTATETTREALDLSLQQLKRLHGDGIGAVDLASAKSYLKGQMPYDFESGADLAGLLCQLTYYDLGRDWIDGLFSRIDAVDEAACRQAIDRWFPEDAMVFAAVGVAREIGELMETYGKVTVRENDAPGFH